MTVFLRVRLRFSVAAIVALMVSATARAEVPTATGDAVSFGFASTTSSSYVDVQTLNVQVDAAKSGLFDIASSMGLNNVSGSFGQTVQGGLAIDGILVQSHSIHLGAGDASVVSIPWQVNLSPGNHVIKLQFADPSGLGVSAASAHLQATGYAAVPGSAPGIPGDYNANGMVDGADYVLWRKGNNTSVTLPNDSTPGTDASDYNVWRSHFGQPPGSGAATSTTAVPEPTTLVLLMFAVTGWCLRRRRSK